MKDEILRRYKRIKMAKLITAIIIDIIGYLSYFIPLLGEGGDIIWGPISGVMIFFLFPHHKKMAFIGAAEELIPFTDFVPSACIAWWLNYIKDKNKTLSEFVIKEVSDEQIVKEILNAKNIGA